MNEPSDMERTRLLRDTVPWPAPARLADGRARLLTAAAAAAGPAAPHPAAPHAAAAEDDAERRGPRRSRSAPAGRRRAFARGGHPRRVLALAAAATAAAVAAGIAGYAISGRTAAPARPAVASRPTASRAHHAHLGSAAGHAVLAAKVLRAAAVHVALRGVTAEPAPGQWIYARTVDDQPTRQPAFQASDNWITFDSTGSAYYQNGQLIVHSSPIVAPGPGLSPWAAWQAGISPKTAYDVLAALPADPRALLAVIVRQMAAPNAGGSPLGSPAPKTRAQREFAYLVEILWNAAGGVGGPPAAEASVYRALATLPGISVQPGVIDAAGNPAIGISADGGYDQVLIDPASYQVTGLRQLSTGIAPVLVPPSAALLRALLADPHAPLPAAPPGTMPLARLRQLLAKASRARQDRLIAQWQQRWVRQGSAHDRVPPRDTVVESFAYAQVAQVARPGQK